MICCMQKRRNSKRNRNRNSSRDGLIKACISLSWIFISSPVQLERSRQFSKWINLCVRAWCAAQAMKQMISQFGIFEENYKIICWRKGNIYMENDKCYALHRIILIWMRNNGLRFSRSFLDTLLPTCFMLGQIKAFIANYMQLVHREARDDWRPRYDVAWPAFRWNRKRPYSRLKLSNFCCFVIIWRSCSRITSRECVYLFFVAGDFDTCGSLFHIFVGFSFFFMLLHTRRHITSAVQ